MNTMLSFRHRFTRIRALGATLCLAGALSLSLGAPARADMIIRADPPPSSLGSFAININAGTELAANSSALAAFQRAANQWVSRISDNITINIAANLTASGFSSANIIGQASSVGLQAAYDTIRNAMVNDSAGQADETIVASLPTQATFRANFGSGATQVTNLAFNKANGKALGLTGLDTQFGSNDGTITFNSAFNFDYDNRDGVGAGQTDFETVAAHEIGHVLGFVSAVDQNTSGAAVVPTTLDLFRFTNDQAGLDPANAADFATYTRDLRQGGDTIFDDTQNEYRLSTVADGNQASHFKANEKTGVLIGIMDPTLAAQEVIKVGDADFRVMDLIGYNIVTAPVPEPSTWAMMILGLGAVGATTRKRKKRVASA